MQFRIWQLLFVFVVLLSVNVGSSYVFAQNFAKTKKINKKTTEPFYISMLFHKLSGSKPNFGIWAENATVYKEASDFDKLAIRKDQENYFDNFYSILNVKEPIRVTFKTKISEYSYTNKGFFIDSFQPDLFFNFQYMGEFFAVIPDGVDNYQWFSVPASDIIDTGLNIKEENEVSLRIVLEPKYADGTKTVQLGKNKYWMILTEVQDIEIWSADDRQLLWRGEKAQDNTLLLNLYR